MRRNENNGINRPATDGRATRSTVRRIAERMMLAAHERLTDLEAERDRLRAVVDAAREVHRLFSPAHSRLDDEQERAIATLGSELKALDQIE